MGMDLLVLYHHRIRCLKYLVGIKAVVREGRAMGWRESSIHVLICKIEKNGWGKAGPTSLQAGGQHP